MNDLKQPLIAVHVGVGGSVGPIDRKQTFQDCLRPILAARPTRRVPKTCGATNFT